MKLSLSGSGEHKSLQDQGSKTIGSIYGGTDELPKNNMRIKQ